jgi:hypothetical protein
MDERMDGWMMFVAEKKEDIQSAEHKEVSKETVIVHKSSMGSYYSDSWRKARLPSDIHHSKNSINKKPENQVPVVHGYNPSYLGC